MVAAGAFPLVKLGLLAVRQIAKPLANWIKTRAKRSFFFRTYICMPPAQMYNWMEVNVKMRMLNLGKPSEVPKLNEAMAIELGAELLGEAIIFFVAAASILAEFIRSSLKEKDKEVVKEQHFAYLESEINYLKFTVDRQEAEIRHLTRVYYALEQNHPNNKQPKNKPSNNESESNVEPGKNMGALQQAIDYAVISIKGKR